MNWLLNRLKEKSTWLAVFTIAGLLGMKVEPELREQIINAILAVAALVAFIFRENIRERSTDRKVDLPPIKLVGTATPDTDRRAHCSPDSSSVDSSAVDSQSRQLRDPVPSEAGFKQQDAARHRNESGWNG